MVNTRANLLFRRSRASAKPAAGMCALRLFDKLGEKAKFTGSARVAHFFSKRFVLLEVRVLQSQYGQPRETIMNM